ncbi:MAG TPA: cupin domain-containing protein [Chthoniobacterales bacterium]|nr:cupin domain-containing protein [Chthoniobacterales bacterium]
MSERANDNPWIDLAPGIRRRTVTHGATMYQMIAELAAGTKMAEHKHPQEQIIHILSGRMTVFANGGAHQLRAGDSYYLASNVPHGVETSEETRVLDTFSPPRDEYIALDEEARRG